MRCRVKNSEYCMYKIEIQEAINSALYYFKFLQVINVE